MKNIFRSTVMLCLFLMGAVSVFSQNTTPTLYNFGNTVLENVVGISTLSNGYFVVGANMEYSSGYSLPTMIMIDETGGVVDINNYREVGGNYDYWTMRDMTSVGNDVFTIGTLSVSQADHDPPYIAKLNGTDLQFIRQLDEIDYGYDVTLQGISSGTNKIMVFGDLDGTMAFFMEMSTSGVILGSRYLNYTKIVGAKYASDGSIYLAAIDVNNYLYFIKLTNTYSVVYANRIGTYKINSDDNQKVFIEEADNGNIIIAAQIIGYGSISWETNVLCVSLNQTTGTSNWGKLIGDISGNYGDDVLQSLETNYSGVIVGMKTINYGLGRADFELVQITNAGVYTGTKCFGGSKDETNFHMTYAYDDLFMIAGETESFDVVQPTLLSHAMDLQYDYNYQIPVYTNIIAQNPILTSSSVFLYSNNMGFVDFDNDGEPISASTFSAFVPENETFVSTIATTQPVTNVCLLNQPNGLIVGTSAFVNSNTNHYFQKYNGQGTIEQTKNLIQSGSNYSDEYYYKLLELYSKNVFVRRRFADASVVFTDRNLNKQSEYTISGLGNYTRYGIHSVSKRNDWYDDVVLSGLLDAATDQIFVCNLSSNGTVSGVSCNGTVSSHSIDVITKDYSNSVLFAMYDASTYRLIDYTETTVNFARSLTPAYTWSNNIIIAAKDGGIYLIHNLTGGVEIYKMPSALNSITWKKYIAGYLVSDAVMSNDGYLLLSGFKNRNPFVLKLDINANAVWGKEYLTGFYTQDNNLDLAISSESKNGFNLIVSGTKNAKNYISTISADKDGHVNSGCQEKNITFTVVNSTYTSATISSITVTMTNFTPTVASGTNFTNSDSQLDYDLYSMDLETSISSTNVSCNAVLDGSALVAIEKGTTPIQISWSNGATGTSISNIAAGSYTATITDAFGCAQTQTAVIQQPAVLAFAYSKTDVTCHNGSNGEASVVATGGTAPYYYNWSNGLKTASIANLYAGNIFVNVTDNKGCGTAVQQVTINQPNALGVTISKDVEISCNGINEGEISAIVSGGTAPYSYEWSNGGTSSNLTNLYAGIYTVTVTDKCGDKSTATVELTEPSALSVESVITNISCAGKNDGTILLTTNGGVAPIEFLWDNGSTNTSISNLKPGLYTVGVRDQCEKIKEEYEVIEPKELNTSIAKTDASCFGKGDGTATVYPEGGTAPYSYSWNTGRNTQTANGLFAGIHSVNIIDANSCITSNSITVGQPLKLSATATVTNLMCNGVADGAIDLTVTSGVAPYSFNWSNAASTEDVSSLSAGMYSVQITDACSDTYTIEKTVIQPDVLSSAQTHTDVSCNAGNNGTATVIVSGGTQPYTYLWSSGETSATISNKTAGTYSVTVTDNCGDMVQEVIEITEPVTLAVTVSKTDISCFGVFDGTATANITGGTAPYIYNWNNGQTTKTAANLYRGTHTVYVSDAKGCIASNSANIDEPATLSATLTTGNNNCNGGSDGNIEVTINGGVPPYAYLWSNAAITEDLQNVAAGVYVVSITDACNQEIVKTASITEPGALILNISKTDVRCNSELNGTATVSASGGTFPYVYIWSDTQTTPKATSLGVATYSVTVEDACGNSESASVDITEPEVLAVVVETTDINCYGQINGEASAIVTGGTLPYNYIWNNGQNSATAMWLNKGQHSVNVIDANGCIASNSGIIAEPQPLTLSLQASVLSCNGGSDGNITSIVSGGTEPYTFNWSSGESTQSLNNKPAGLYTLTLTDACNAERVLGATITEPAAISLQILKTDISCKSGNNGTAEVIAQGGTSPYSYNWDNGSTDAKIIGLSAGNYSVVVSDACSSSKNSLVTITEPDSLKVNVTTTDITCFGSLNGTATALATGGTLPYNYIWNNGQTAKKAVGLFQGRHTVNIIDANGCTASNSGDINQPEQLTASFDVENIDCYGAAEGSITSTIVSGLLPVQYEWSTGETTPDIQNVVAGIYTVSITDACGDIYSQSIEVNQIEAANITVNTNNVTCNGRDNGSIQILVSGGASPYQYLWNNGETTNLITNLAADTYIVTITDNCNAEFVKSINITEPDILDFTITKTDILCNGQLSGTATVNVTGGTQPYNYVWNNGQRTQTAINLYPGSHTISVLDAQGCTASNSVQITQPAPMNVQFEVINVQCNGASDGEIIAKVSNGTQPYTYQWSNDSTGAQITNLPAGTYSVEISDACGNGYSQSMTINQPSVLDATVNLQDIRCYGEENGSASVSVNGGTAPYYYIWSNESENSYVNNLSAGVYTVTVSDQCAAEKTLAVAIVQPEFFDINVLKTDATCFGAGDGSAVVDVLGGKAPFIYKWNIGLQGSELKGLFKGTYSVNVFDANACLASEIFEIGEPTQLAVQLNSIGTQCGVESGSVEAIVSGGTEPYQYLWSDNSVDVTITGIASGDYAITVTDANNCAVHAKTEVGVYVEGYNICILTVDKKIGKNKIVWEKTDNSSITNVDIYRMIGGDYQWMGRVPSSKNSYFDDELSNPKVVPARYAIVSLDACGNESEMSPFHQTIHLGSAKGIDGTTVVLDWTEYIDESGAFKPKWYYLYRGRDESKLVLFDSVDATVATEYNDVDPKGATLYRVAVNKVFQCVASGLKSDSGPYSQSISNITEAEFSTNLNEESGVICNIFPNPSQGKFFVEFDEYEGANAEITNISGQVIWKSDLSSNKTFVDISSERLGIYYLNIRIGAKLIVKEFVIQK